MYLHLGSNISVRGEEIIGIFDLDNASSSPVTRAFLRAAEEEGMVIAVGEDLPKSVVVCCPQGSWQRVYISPLTSATLLRRLEEGGLGSGRPGADRDEQSAGTGRPRP